MSNGPRSIWKRNGLSIVLLALMLIFLCGQAITGHFTHNEELAELGAPAVSFLAYLWSGHFVSATFENWESEFLQMGMYVMLTASLRQAGSAESRPLSEDQEQPRIAPGPSPWPVRAGGVWKTLYGHSLAIAFGLLFLASFLLHWAGSWRREAEQRLLKGEPSVSMGEYLTDVQFWFESFQNWQSEYMAVASIVLLSIWLRQRDSTQSKPLDAPHSQTGT